MAFKVKDFYFHQAKKDHFLARSVYKLEEIDLRYKILKPGQRVVDLGYHPGSWIQYTSKIIGLQGSVVGIDIRPLNNDLSVLPNVKVLEYDAFNVASVQDLGETEPFDVLLSDMAPNTTGNKTVDQLRSLNLVEKIFEIMPVFLKPQGSTIIKVFESHQAQLFLKEELKRFKESHYLRPKSTRTTSKEFFVIAKGFKA
jgi:23S rRNA (uridine2552-2'-O)-methyltransferase